MASRLTLLLSRRGLIARRAPRPRPHPKAYLADDTGLKVTLPYAPRTVELGGITPAWTTAARAGRKPLLLREGDQLRVQSYELVIADPTDHTASVEQTLHVLRDMARRGGRIVPGGFGPSEFVTASWRMTDYRQRSVLRQHGTNHITRATVEITLVEASEAAVAVGPVTGGAQSPPAIPPPPAAGPAPVRTHTVARGDTLWAIAVRFYGDGNKWRLIADANGVRDPRKLAVGTVLRIPDLAGRLPGDPNYGADR